MRLYDLEIAIRHYNTLRKNEVKMLTMLTAEDLMTLRGIGRRSVEEMQDGLAKHGLSLRKKETTR